MKTHTPSTDLAFDSIAKSWCGRWLPAQAFDRDSATCPECSEGGKKTMFINDLRRLLTCTKVLARRYESLLPEEVRKQHWMLAKGDPNAWRSVGLLFPGVPGLVGAQVLTEITAQLEGLIAEEKQAGTPPDLTLGRMR